MSDHTYDTLTPEETEEHLSQFIIDSWSYSKVTTFARHEAAFELQHIYKVYSRSSSTTIAGNAYHAAHHYYWVSKSTGIQVDLIELQKAAYEYIDSVGADKWKLQKTTPTMEAAIQDATKKVTTLLSNFYTERALYEEEIAEVLAVEVYGDEWVTVNGVDIPLPLHFMIDFVVRLKNGRVVIVDHKSKSSYTPEEEAAMVIGKQAITYVIGWEKKTEITVDEVWFVENKISQNKDRSPQLVKIVVEITPDTRKLYESLLYTPLKRMIAAVNDPDYEYMINDADNNVDLAEIYEMWARMMLSELTIDDLRVDPNKKEMIAKRIKKIKDSGRDMIPASVVRKFKENADKFIQYDMSDKDMTPQEKIEHVLRSFRVIARVAHSFEGYSSDTFLLEVSAGIKVASIYQYRLDIANALNVPDVRIGQQMKVHDGRAYLSIEIVKTRTKNLDYNKEDLVGYKIPVGKDNYGNTVIWNMDNQSTPHMLVCGGTGSGKSVFLTSTMAYALEAGVEELYIMDPKREFDHMHDQNRIFVYNEILEIEEQMSLLVKEMEELVRTKRKKRIMIVFDEFADAIENARKGPELDIKEMVQVGEYAPKKGLFGLPMPAEPKMKLQKTGQHKSLEENMLILLQKGRSLGFRIICAMQRGSTKVIRGDAKVNMPVQVCFKVSKAVDSKVVLDEQGAENLAGYGDGLIRSPEYNDTVRFQAYYKG